ncbi:MAG: hypothetical protein KDA77_00920 [Planctomycetaceae bacterium]|nr:hypothetical protein [Planctomycetaceae bacterium]
MTHEIEVKDAEFLKVSTNTYGGLRFKTNNEAEAVKMYAEQISTDRLQFTVKDVKALPGFKIATVKDKQRCLKPLTSKTLETSLTESSK